MSKRHWLLAVFAVALAAWFVRGQENANDARAQQNDAQIQQYVQLLQPAMWSELDFIRQVCDLAPEQRPQIKNAAEIATKEAAKAILQPQRGVLRLSQPT